MPHLDATPVVLAGAGLDVVVVRRPGAPSSRPSWSVSDRRAIRVTDAACDDGGVIGFGVARPGRRKDAAK